MNKKQRTKIINGLAGKSAGKAVQEEIQEHIESLQSEAVNKTKNYEQVLGKRFAIEKLKSIKRRFNEPKENKGKTDYT